MLPGWYMVFKAWPPKTSNAKGLAGKGHSLPQEAPGKFFFVFS